MYIHNVSLPAPCIYRNMCKVKKVIKSEKMDTRTYERKIFVVNSNNIQYLSSVFHIPSWLLIKYLAYLCFSSVL